MNVRFYNCTCFRLRLYLWWWLSWLSAASIPSKHDQILMSALKPNFNVGIKRTLAQRLLIATSRILCHENIFMCVYAFYI